MTIILLNILLPITAHEHLPSLFIGGEGHEGSLNAPRKCSLRPMSELYVEGHDQWTLWRFGRTYDSADLMLAQLALHFF
jgi:hypothetical protein